MPNLCDVLIVDDSPIDQRFMELHLQRAGISCATASNGAQAVERARTLGPFVILMDVSMDGMDGFDACSLLKADERTSKIPVIFVTAHEGREIEAWCFEAGGADFITKPVVAATLLARVRAHMAASSDRRRLEGMFRDVIEYAPVAFLLTDRSGQLVTVNADALATFGVPRDAMLNSHLTRWIPDIASRIALHDPPAHTDPFEMDCQRADGSRFAADITVGHLRSTKEALDLFIVRNIEERRRTLQALQDSRTRLRALGAQNESARENERKSIAREVHDELGQVMTALRMDLSMAEMRFGAQLPELREKIGTMKGLVDRAIAGVRQIAANLRPPALDMGLAAAIEWLVAEFRRNNSAQVQMDLQGLQDAALEDRAMTIYRIVQESLNNIAKYAHASTVRIAVRRSGTAMDLSVQDNGVGFDPEQPAGKRSFGLLGMRERALSIGGELVIDSQPGHGTHVHAHFPMDLAQGQQA